MSVLIRDMDMPRCCAECEWGFHTMYFLVNEWRCKRNADIKPIYPFDMRHKDCPLEEVVEEE